MTCQAVHFVKTTRLDVAPLSRYTFLNLWFSFSIKECGREYLQNNVVMLRNFWHTLSTSMKKIHLIFFENASKNYKITFKIIIKIIAVHIHLPEPYKRFLQDTPVDDSTSLHENAEIFQKCAPSTVHKRRTENRFHQTFFLSNGFPSLVEQLRQNADWWASYWIWLREDCPRFFAFHLWYPSRHIPLCEPEEIIHGSWLRIHSQAWYSSSALFEDSNDWFNNYWRINCSINNNSL